MIVIFIYVELILGFGLMNDSSTKHVLYLRFVSLSLSNIDIFEFNKLIRQVILALSNS